MRLTVSLSVPHHRYAACRFTVPPALLEFSRSVMRSKFNSIISKPVATLDIDRNILVDAHTVEKMRVAPSGRYARW